MIPRAEWPCQVNWTSPQARYLVGWYPVLPFERDAKLRDLTPNRRHVTTVGDAPAVVGSELRRMPGLLFDGTNDYVQLGTVSTFVTASVGAWSCWVRPMAASYKTGGNAYDLNSIISDTGGYLGLVIGDFASGGQKIHAYNNNQVASAVAAFVQYRWYHVVWAHAGGTLYLYIDGVLQQTNASGATGAVNNALRIGHGWGGYANLEVMDVRMYSAPPNPLAIKQMYDPATRWQLYRPVSALSVTMFGFAGGSTISERDGTASGVGTATGVSADLEARTGSGVGTGTASGQSGATVGRDGVAAGTGASTGAAARVDGQTGSSAGSGQADGVSGKTVGVDGTSAGQGVATGQGEDAALTGSDGTSAGQGAATGQSARVEQQSGSSSGTSTADGASAATVGRQGTAAGVGQADGAPGTMVGVSGQSTGQAVAVGVPEGELNHIRRTLEVSVDVVDELWLDVPVAETIEEEVFV